MAHPPADKFAFENFEFDPARRVLLKDGERIALNSKGLDLLQVLVQNHGEVLTKDELMDRVWPGQFVEENNLTVQMSALRKALGDAKGKQELVITVPGRGYSFAAAVRRISPEISALAIAASNGAASSGEISAEGLIGRQRELNEIATRFLKDGQRLVTLTGAGGSGKSRLAEAAGQAMAGTFRDGVFFVPLADLRDPDQFPETFAEALKIVSAGAEPHLDLIAEYLAERSALVILDNFEQILPAAGHLKKILEACPRLSIIVTSRIPLQLRNECELKIEPLDLPPAGIHIPAEELIGYPAVQLFLVRSREAKPSFVADEHTIVPAAEICRRLDGLPLAIELAAARVKLLSVPAILSRIENSLKLLTGGSKGSPDRQQTMRAAVKWSFDLLGDDEKLLFARLSVFEGGFTVEAAEEIAAGSEELPVLDMITGLLESNLLTSKDQPDGSVRLRMLEVVREFAVDQLGSGDESSLIRGRHAGYFRTFSETAEPHLLSERSVEWLEKLEGEHDNMLSAIAWSLDNDPASAAVMAAALRYFWSGRGYFSRGLQMLGAALERSGDLPLDIRFKLQNGIGQLSRNRGDYETAEKVYEESLAAAAAEPDLRQMIVAHHGLAAIATRRGDFRSARKYNNEVLKISRKTSDDIGSAIALASLADLALAESDSDTARPLIEESLEVARKHGHKQLLMTNLVNLGLVDFADSEFDRAHAHFSEALDIAQALGSKTIASCSLDGLGALAAEARQYERGAFLAGAADEMRRSVGYEIEPAERIFCELYTEKLREALGHERYTKAFERGATLTLHDAALLGESPMPALSGEVPKLQTDIDSEIIIESRSFSRIILEEEIEDL